MGLFLFVWWCFTLYMTVASARTTVPLFAVFVVLNVAFICLIVGNFDKGTHPDAAAAVVTAGGWFGLLCASLAWYCSAAAVIKATWGRDVLPQPPMPKLCEPRRSIGGVAPGSK